MTLEREALARYRAWTQRQAALPSLWAAYRAGFAAGGVYVAHTSGRLSDPQFREAICVLAEVLAVERGPPAEEVRLKP